MLIMRNYRIFLLSVLIIVILFSGIGCSGYSIEEQEQDEMYYYTGISHFEFEDYEHAIKYLSNVSSYSKYYDDAKQKIIEAENLKEKQKKEEQEQEIEKKYQTGIELIKEGKWEDASLKLVLLQGKGYKDSYVLYSYSCAEKKILEGDFRMMMHYLNNIPEDYQGDLVELILLRKQEIIENKDELQKELEIIKEEREAQAAIKAKEKLRAEAILERISFKWYQSSRSYVTAEGEVKNIIGVPLRNVMAVITYRTKEGDFITYDRALIEYNPIMPDQKSPFKVITTYNPLMDTAYLEFQFLSGEKIPHYFE